MQAQITREISNGKVWLKTVHRGVEYSIARGEFGWTVYTRRLALGRFNIGSVRVFPTLAAATEKYKVFLGIELINAL